MFNLKSGSQRMDDDSSELEVDNSGKQREISITIVKNRDNNPNGRVATHDFFMVSL